MTTRSVFEKLYRNARLELSRHVQPRDGFEHDIIAALGDISWDEAVEAIERHRRAQTVEGK